MSYDFQSLGAHSDKMSFFDLSGEMQGHQPQYNHHNIPDPNSVNRHLHETYLSAYPTPYPTDVETFVTGSRTYLGLESMKKTPLSHHKMTSSACAKYNLSSAGERISNATCRMRTYSDRRSTGERRDCINERERERMHMLCDAFEKLRQVLPFKKSKRGPHRQKLSKIATLMFAQSYIKTLEDILQNPGEYADCIVSSEKQNETRRAAQSQDADRVGDSLVFNQTNFYQQYNSDVFVGEGCYP